MKSKWLDKYTSLDELYKQYREEIRICVEKGTMKDYMNCINKVIDKYIQYLDIDEMRSIAVEEIFKYLFSIPKR